MTKKEFDEIEWSKYSRVKLKKDDEYYKIASVDFEHRQVAVIFDQYSLMYSHSFIEEVKSSKELADLKNRVRESKKQLMDALKEHKERENVECHKVIKL